MNTCKVRPRDFTLCIVNCQYCELFLSVGNEGLYAKRECTEFMANSVQKEQTNPNVRLSLHCTHFHHVTLNCVSNIKEKLLPTPFNTIEKKKAMRVAVDHQFGKLKLPIIILCNLSKVARGK